MVPMFLIAMFIIVMVIVAQRWFDVRKNKGDPKTKSEEGTKSEDVVVVDGAEVPADKSDKSAPIANDKKKPTVEGDKDSPFLIKPYIQLGTEHTNSNDALELVWHAKNEPGIAWTVKVKPLAVVDGATPLVQQLNVVDNGIPELLPVVAHRQFRAVIADRSHGERFVYEVFRNDQMVFTAEASAPKRRGAKFRFIAVGDIGEGSAGEAKVAYQMSKHNADFVVVPGDVAYKRGRLSENIEKFFPVMNSDETSPEKGAPLMRSTLFVACPGNHDYGRPSLSDVPDLDRHPDLFAYFYLWSQPLNGPYIGGARNAQVLHGAEDRREAFLKASAGRYPRMANFSFDYSDTHWTYLDANEHMDWTSEDLRNWVRNDLTMTSAHWKFVVFHQPCFSSHIRHSVEERMRLLCDIFQECGVDIVWMGHAHWYERMHPIKFFVRQQLDGRLIGPDGSVDGDIQIDRNFDGMSVTRPNGIMYIVTGGGGAPLHQSSMPGNLEPFTHKLIADRHSFTVVDVDLNSVSIRQISEDGDELDRFTVTK